MSKLYLKGFSNFGIIPVTEDTEGSYKAAGERIRLSGAQSCAPTDNKESYSIPGDDGIYDSGTEWKNSTLEVVVAEMTLEQLQLLGGSTIDENSTELEEGVFDHAPVYALTFSALRSDGGYRLYRYYAAKCTNYKIQHNTRGQSNDAQTYSLSFEASPRKVDGCIRGTKDVAKGEALTWLNTVPVSPAEQA